METAFAILGVIGIIALSLFLRKVLKSLGEMEEEIRRRQRWDD